MENSKELATNELCSRSICWRPPRIPRKYRVNFYDLEFDLAAWQRTIISVDILVNRCAFIITCCLGTALPDLSQESRCKILPALWQTFSYEAPPRSAAAFAASPQLGVWPVARLQLPSSRSNCCSGCMVSCPEFFKACWIEFLKLERATSWRHLMTAVKRCV